MENKVAPQSALARKVLPPPLLKCIERIFAQKLEGTALVGGTALSGYYAGHRRSDDIDLFSSGETPFRAAVLAVKSLEKSGAVFSNLLQSAQYFHANCLYSEQRFTIDVVLDENLFRVGQFESVEKGVTVATLETLLRMKSATLVSRAGEKDLYDMQWLLKHFPLGPAEWIALGQSVDLGMNPQSILASLAGKKLREEACDFGMGVSPAEIFKSVSAFQKKLIQELVDYIKSLPTPPLGTLVKRLR